MVPNAAVNAALLQQIHGWIEAGATEDDVIDRLRLQAVPTGYALHTWIGGLHLIIYRNGFLNLMIQESRKAKWRS